MISINDLAKMASTIARKNITIKNIDGPIGVMGRTSDNTLINDKLSWKPNQPLEAGLEKTYRWIEGNVNALKAKPKKERSNDIGAEA